MDWIPAGDGFGSGLGDNLQNDTVIALIDTDGVTQLAHNDDNPANPPASRITWPCPATGTYFARVSQFRDWVGGCDFTYNLELSMAEDHRIFVPLCLR